MTKSSQIRPRSGVCKLYLPAIAALLGTLAAASPASAQPPDTIRISRAGDTTVTDYPYQFGRPFVQGEIRHFPQVLVNGTPIVTQADVKDRYPDKSVKFAVISVVIPSIPAKGALTLSFADQPSGNNKPRLSRNMMLGPSFDFDAAFSLAQGHTAYADARNMLHNGDYTYWTSGSVADTIILVDNSAARKYDIGFDAYKSVRPEFIATFWPSLNKVEVRVVGENEDSQDLEDVTAALTITLGNSSPQTVYTNPRAGSLDTKTFTTYAGTSWNKTFWIGGAPDPKIDIDYNIQHLSATGFIPNFDPSLKSQFTDSVIAQWFSRWQSLPKDLYDAGEWDKSMPDSGGRPDIGIEPGWMMDWLYSGNWRARQMAIRQADLAGSWQLMVREGDPTDKYDRAQTMPAIGLPLSMFAYPSEWLFDSQAKHDRILIYTESIPHPSLTGQPSQGGLGWIFDTAHQPDPFSIPYMLTGDPFYLEELQIWAASNALMTPINPSASLPANYPDVARTASPVIAGFGNQVRGDAWALRNRARAAFLSPDGSPEQAYFQDIMRDMIAEWEGARSIYDPLLDTTPAWVYGNTEAHRPYISPLHFFLYSANETQLCSDCSGFVHGQTYAESPWQQGYLLIALGNAQEMGFPTSALLAWMAPQWTNQIDNPTYNPKLIASYVIPQEASGHPPLFTNWDQVQEELTPDSQVQTVQDFDDATGDYAVIATGAVAMLTGHLGGIATWRSGGMAAWNFVDVNVRQNPKQMTQYIDNNESGWDILPRETPVYTSPAH